MVKKKKSRRKKGKQKKRLETHLRKKKQADASEADEPSMPVQICIGFLLLNLHIGIIFVLVEYVSALAAIVSGVFMGLAIMIGGAIMGWGGGMVYAGILAMSLGSFCGVSAHDYYRAKQGVITEKISVTEFHRHRDADVCLFKDGRIRRDLTGSYLSVYRHKQETTRTWHYVAPVVPDGWTKKDEIPLWVAATSRIPDLWDRDGGAAFAVSPLFEGDFSRAADEAVRREGLKRTPFHFVKWAESYEEGVETHRIMFILPLIACNGLWLIGMAAGAALAWGDAYEKRMTER